ncbi:NADH-quinone oxidoreductase subunit J [Tardisphaera miroshnichenkoae]
MRILLEIGMYASTVLLIAFAALAVSHKSMIYSALFLAFLGLTNAALFFALGYAFVAFVQVVVYVGASVLFLIISVSMLREPKESGISYAYPITGAVAVLALGLLFIYVFGSAVEIVPHAISYSLMASEILNKGGVATYVLFLLLALGLITSVTVSLRGEKE